MNYLSHVHDLAILKGIVEVEEAIMVPRKHLQRWTVESCDDILFSRVLE